MSDKAKVSATVEPAVSIAVPQRSGANPIVVLLFILLVAAGLTYLLDSGSYQRTDGLVVAGSYQVIEKDRSLSNLFGSVTQAPAGEARPVGVIDVLQAIPAGLQRGAGLIFMVLIIGGMFGILNKSGAVDAGLERLISAVKGNVYGLVIFLMTMFALGSTFLGLASEYLLIIPLMVELARRLGMSNLIGLAILTIAVKVGYLSSITNPLPLTIAQPLLGLPIFSGAGMRTLFFAVFLVFGIAYMLWVIKKTGFKKQLEISFDSRKLSLRHLVLLLIMLVGIAGLVYASNTWQWKNQQLSAYYIGMSILLACCSGLGASGAADAFVSGMKKILLASILIGVAFAIAITLENGKVLDAVVHGLVSIIGEDNSYLAVLGMFVSQLLLDVMIPSTSGQAAVSMPILGPIGQLSGVGAQTTVLTFLFGNGITNMITPTSGTLLAYLATAQVSWTDWARFILPLVLIFIVLACMMLFFAVYVGF
ncbi:C4-dicarboxylate anaerobic carrier [Alishewanella agri BL06]|uniref:C4-dicarboxylate anaerobic carrier n=1 Tax=Alishewanella agri BL06 TaxID=1195246 RepID=I8U3U6_9ALTE|nr:YfcC family protein [Alishewanella agri]EIW88006.1 C4-dicarboxylate anaerobic carrier [Alishewanella agri BL06]